MIRLVQLRSGSTRAVALVDEPNLRVLVGVTSMYALAQAALYASKPLEDIVRRRAHGATLAYDDIYKGRSEWRLVVPIDHPEDEARCLVSGTGLTHLGSAENRNAMHGKSDAELTDSMRMFRAGLEGGRPAPGAIGAAPEWFYKGNGGNLRAPNDPLDVPAFAGDGGEEAEIAGVYVIDHAGQPRRIGLCCGNEFSDHIFERTNYLNLASSKLRTCAIGPELVIGAAFTTVTGRVAIERAGGEIWSRAIATGNEEMCHTVANIEHHHFKFPMHRRAGDLHVHFFGAHSLSFGQGIVLEDADVMVVQFDGFGRALRNPVRKTAEPDRVVAVDSL